MYASQARQKEQKQTLDDTDVTRQQATTATATNVAIAAVTYDSCMPARPSRQEKKARLNDTEVTRQSGNRHDHKSVHRGIVIRFVNNRAFCVRKTNDDTDGNLRMRRAIRAYDHQILSTLYGSDIASQSIAHFVRAVVAVPVPPVLLRCPPSLFFSPKHTTEKTQKTRLPCGCSTRRANRPLQAYGVHLPYLPRSFYISALGFLGVTPSFADVVIRAPRFKGGLSCGARTTPGP